MGLIMSAFDSDVGYFTTSCNKMTSSIEKGWGGCCNTNHSLIIIAIHASSLLSQLPQVHEKCITVIMYVNFKKIHV